MLNKSSKKEKMGMVSPDLSISLKDTGANSNQNNRGNSEARAGSGGLNVSLSGLHRIPGSILDKRD